jgi:AcrR family transcriptional regulator
MNYQEFKKKYGATGQEISKDVFRQNIDSIKIKKEKTAVNNLEKIFNAVFKVAYRKGFQAMSMRDLIIESGISLGALYDYFPGKEKLLEIIQSHGWEIIKKKLDPVSKENKDCLEKLKAIIKAHIYLSELFRPWFYFTFMEARHIKPAGFEVTKSMEEHTHRTLLSILILGEEKKIFKPGNHDLTACMIKSMQQDWYLKRWKYKQMNISVDQFADHLLSIVEPLVLL